MWIKEHYNQNTFTVLQILQYLNKKYVLKFFGKVTIIKAPGGFELMTYGFVVNVLTHCATLLGRNISL